GDEPRHVFDVLGGAHDLFRRLDVQEDGVLQKGLFVLARICVNAKSGGGCSVDNFVIHIGDVNDLANLVSALAQESAQRIHDHIGAEVADVAVVVNGGSAGIHADQVVVQRLEITHPRR